MADERSANEPDERHVEEADAGELREEDRVGDAMADPSGVVDGSGGGGGGSTTSDPGRRNPIVPGEGRLDEPRP